jgi:hypothetical protein
LQPLLFLRSRPQEGLEHRKITRSRPQAGIGWHTQGGPSQKQQTGQQPVSKKLLHCGKSPEASGFDGDVSAKIASRESNRFLRIDAHTGYFEYPGDCEDCQAKGRGDYLETSAGSRRSWFVQCPKVDPCEQFEFAVQQSVELSSGSPLRCQSLTRSPVEKEGAKPGDKRNACGPN